MTGWEQHWELQREQEQKEREQEREQSRNKRKRPAGRGQVYLVTDGEFCKIGITTTTVESRLSDLRVGNPRVIEKLFSAEHPHPRTAERELHKRFVSKRAAGEWFALTGEDIRSAKLFLQPVLEG